MKKNILTSFLLFISLSAFGQSTDNNCSLYGEVNEFINSMFDSNCLVLEGDARCACLATEGSNNFMIAELEKKNNIKRYQEELRVKRTDHFWKVYSQMTHGAAIQQEIIFKDEMDNSTEEKVVGCPPTELSSQFQSKLNDHVTDLKKKQKTALEEVSTELQTCRADRKRNCDLLLRQQSKLQEEFNVDKKTEYEAICNNTKLSNQKTAAQVSLEKAREWYQTSNLTSGEKEQKIKKIDCYLTKINSYEPMAYQKYANLGCIELIGPLDTSGIAGLGTGASLSNMNAVKLENGEMTCSKNSSEIVEFMKEVDNQRLGTIRFVAREGGAASADATDISGGELIHISECKDDLCKNFEKTNLDVLNALKQDFQQSSDLCISYPEFLMMKGIPGDEFMKELATLTDDKLADALTIPKAINNKADKERLEFLRSNPLIAKLALKDDTRLAMATALRDMAKSPDHKTPAEKLDKYLAFMKGPVKDMIKNEDFKSQQQFICNQMINSYTAIQVATDLPPLKEDASAFPLQAAVRECQISLNNKTSVTAIAESLKMDELFREVAGDEPGKTDHELYQDLNKEHCGGFKDFKQGCKKDAEGCRQDFLARSGLKDQQNVMNKFGAARNLGRQNFERVANQSRQSHQDEGFKRWWHKKIGSRLSKNVIPYKGSEDEFKHDKAQDKAQVASSEVPEKYKSHQFDGGKSSTSEVAQVQPAGQPVVNPGQIVPSYSNAPVFDPSKLVPGQSVTKAITNFETLSPAQKIEGLKEAEEYIKEKKSSFDEEDLEEKLAETKEKIAEEKAHQEEIEKQIAEKRSHQPASPQFSSAVNQTNHVPNVSQGSTNSGSATTFGKTNGLSKTSGGFGAVNEALKNKEESKGREPTSVKEPVDLTVKSGVVGPEDLKGKLEIQTELTAASPAEFASLSQNASDLEKYLELNLDKKEIGDGKIISIINPSNDTPVKHLIFKVNIQNGKYVVQSMPSNVRIQRSSTLDRLKLNFKQFGKKSI